MVPESPQVRDAINRLVDKGTKVVQFLTGKRRQSTADFVGVDKIKAGATVAKLIGRFSCQRRGSVIVASETMRAQDSIARRHGIDNILNTDFPQLRALPSLETHADEDRTPVDTLYAIGGDVDTLDTGFHHQCASNEV